MIAAPKLQSAFPKFRKLPYLDENHHLPLTNAWLEKFQYRIEET